MPTNKNSMIINASQKKCLLFSTITSADPIAQTFLLS